MARWTLDDIPWNRFDRTKVDVEIFKHIGRYTGAFLYQAKKDVLGADVFVVEALRLLVGELHHLAGPISKTFIHFLPSPTPGRIAQSVARPRLVPGQALGWGVK